MKKTEKKRSRGARRAGQGPTTVDRSGRTKDTLIVISAAKPNLAGLRSVAREWLVPRLVEAFLREQGVVLSARRRSSSPGKLPFRYE